MRSRLFRVVIPLLVICCMIFNWATIPAQASVSLAAGFGIGAAACAILWAAGVVFRPQTAQEIVAIGQSMVASLDEWCTITNAHEIVTDWYVDLNALDFGGGDDGGHRNTQIRLAQSLLAGITAWVASVAIAGIDVVSDTVPDGYAYYNGWLLPQVDTLYNSTHGYRAIYLSPDDGNPSSVIISYSPLVLKIGTDGVYTGTYTPNWSYNSNALVTYQLIDGAWGSELVQMGGGGVRSWYRYPIWSNVDLYDSAGNLVLPGTEPTQEATTTIYPSYLIGDIAPGNADRCPG